MLQDAAEDEDASTMESEDEGSFEHVQVSFTVPMMLSSVTWQVTCFCIATCS